MVRSWLRGVKDPEVPVLDIVELGLVRSIQIGDAGEVQVDITPTYSGCPAMEVIEGEVAEVLAQHGVVEGTVKRVFSPPWTTAWMTSEAREKLQAYGIAPPPSGEVESTSPVAMGATVRAVPCPFCGSTNTTLQSAFGSTACKSLHTCQQCHQPFEHFKAH